MMAHMVSSPKTRKSRFVNISYNNRARTVTFQYFQIMLSLLSAAMFLYIISLDFAKHWSMCRRYLFKKQTKQFNSSLYIICIAALQIFTPLNTWLWLVSCIVE